MQGNNYNDAPRNLTWIKMKLQENEKIVGSKFLVGQRITRKVNLSK